MPFLPLRDAQGEILSWARVDQEDYDDLAQWSWYLGSHGYAVRVWDRGDYEKKLHVLMHRYLMDLGPGDKRVVDHINHNRVDNRRSNLRVVTTSQNLCNRRKPFQGVCYWPSRDRWQAYTSTAYGPRRTLGYFDTREDARAAVEAAHEEMALALAS